MSETQYTVNLHLKFLKARFHLLHVIMSKNLTNNVRSCSDWHVHLASLQVNSRWHVHLYAIFSSYQILVVGHVTHNAWLSSCDIDIWCSNIEMSTLELCHCVDTSQSGYCIWMPHLHNGASSAHCHKAMTLGLDHLLTMQRTHVCHLWFADHFSFNTASPS